MKRSEYDELIDGASKTQMKKVNARLRDYLTEQVNERLLALIFPYRMSDYDWGVNIQMDNGPEGDVQVHMREANVCHAFGQPFIPDQDFTFPKAELFTAEGAAFFSR